MYIYIYKFFTTKLNCKSIKYSQLGAIFTNSKFTQHNVTQHNNKNDTQHKR